MREYCGKRLNDVENKYIDEKPVGSFKVLKVLRHNDKNGGHPHFIVGGSRRKGYYVSFDVTHSPYRKSRQKNLRLKYSPFPDGGISYYRSTPCIDFCDNYIFCDSKSGCRFKYGVVDLSDYERMDSILSSWYFKTSYQKKISLYSQNKKLQKK